MIISSLIHLLMLTSHLKKKIEHAVVDKNPYSKGLL